MGYVEWIRTKITIVQQVLMQLPTRNFIEIRSERASTPAKTHAHKVWAAPQCHDLHFPTIVQ